MQFQPVVLFRLFGAPVYAYGLALALAALVCVLFLWRRARRHGLRAQTTGIFTLWALALGIALARLCHCALWWQTMAYDWDNQFRGLGFILRLWEGGYNVCGAFAGVLLAVWIAAARTRQPAKALLDWAAPPCALMIALARTAELLGGGGFGAEVLSPSLSFFPIAVFNDWMGGWNYAVFMGEAAAAGVIAYLLLRLERRAHRPGDIGLLMLLYYGASQLVLERFRRDAFAAWGFVRVAQVMAAVLILFCAAVAVIRMLKSGKRPARAWLTAAFTLAAVTWAGLTEYLFDKNLFGLVIGNAWLHLSRAALLLILSILLTRRLLAAARQPAAIPPPAAAPE